MNLDKIRRCIKTLLLEIEGTDELREGIKETPNRVARMYEEIFNGYNNNDDNSLIKVFKHEDIASELVISKNIKFYSICEHHMLPFYGRVDVAYLSNEGNIIGISKLSRIVDKFAHRLNIQEKMTNDICKFIYESDLKPASVMVVIEALHLCEVMRGVKKENVKMVTSSVKGDALNNLKLRSEILSLIDR